MATISKDINKELNIAIYTVHGVAGYDDIRAEIDKYYSGPLTRYVIWDFSEKGTDVNLKPDEVRKLADAVCAQSKARRGCYDLLVIPNNMQYALVRIFIAYIEINNNQDGDLKTVMFHKTKDAYRWIHEEMMFGKTDWLLPPREGSVEKPLM